MINRILSISPTVTLFYPECYIHFVQVLVEVPFSLCLNRGQVIFYGFADKLNFVQVYSSGSNRCKQFSSKWKKIGICTFDLCENICYFLHLLYVKIFLFFCMPSILF